MTGVPPLHLWLFHVLIQFFPPLQGFDFYPLVLCYLFLFILLSFLFISPHLVSFPHTTLTLSLSPTPFTSIILPSSHSLFFVSQRVTPCFWNNCLERENGRISAVCRSAFRAAALPPELIPARCETHWSRLLHCLAFATLRRSVKRATKVMKLTSESPWVRVPRVFFPSSLSKVKFQEPHWLSFNCSVKNSYSFFYLSYKGGWGWSGLNENKKGGEGRNLFLFSQIAFESWSWFFSLGSLRKCT